MLAGYSEPGIQLWGYPSTAVQPPVRVLLEYISATLIFFQDDLFHLRIKGEFVISCSRNDLTFRRSTPAGTFLDLRRAGMQGEVAEEPACLKNVSFQSSGLKKFPANLKCFSDKLDMTRRNGAAAAEAFRAAVPVVLPILPGSPRIPIPS
ncbi:MAG: hypothetical protein DMG90_03970 [Acidobacteria bacterium]|nr:MAG: hypothetical protein DMG90_03970 [Acidobacteriota bacterium]